MNGWMRALAWVVLSSVCVGAEEPAATPVERVALRTEDGKIEITAPKSWNLEWQGDDASPMRSRFTGEMQDPKGRLQTILVDVYPARAHEKPRGLLSRETFLEQLSGAATRMELKPRPMQVTVEDRDGTKYVILTMAKMIAERSYALELRGLDLLDTAMRAECFSILDSIKTKHPPYVRVPRGFKRSIKGSLEWWVDPSVSSKLLKPLHAVASNAVRRFTKVHGSLRRERVRVFVLQPGDTGTSFGHTLHSEISCDWVANSAAVLARPMTAQDQIHFAKDITQASFHARYGTSIPDLLFDAEGLLGWNHQVAGKLPIVESALYDSLPPKPRPLLEIVMTVPNTDRREHQPSAFLWAGYFARNAGPRRAYVRFLTEISNGAPVAETLEKFFPAEQSEKRLAAVRKWRRNLRTPEAPKR